MFSVGDIVGDAVSRSEGRIGVVVEVFPSGNVLVRLDQPEVFGIPAPCNCEIFLPHALEAIGREETRHRREVERQALIAARREQEADAWEPEQPTPARIDERMERMLNEQLRLFG
jgi:hypothetical protein